MNEEFLRRFVEMLQVSPVSSEETRLLEDASHEELCKAFEYWFNQLRLLFGQSVEILITQGLHDEGVDLLVQTTDAKTKLGIQIKSQNDFEDKLFHKNVLSQIARSRKHDITRLLLVLCSDVTGQQFMDKTRAILSDISQMGDYVMPMIQEKAVVVLKCYRAKQHPLNFVKGMQEIARLMEGFSKALTSESYDAHVLVELKLKSEPNPADYTVRGHIAFKPGASSIKGFDLFRVATEAGQPVTIPGDLIERVQFLDINGKAIIPPEGKVEYFKIVPNIAKLPLVCLKTKDIRTGEVILLDKIQFIRERSEGSTLYLVSNDQPHAYTLNLEVDFERLFGKLTGEMDPSIADVSDALTFATFMAGVNKNGFEMQDVSGTVVLSTKEPPATNIDLAPWLQLLQNASDIQSKLRIKIPAPETPTSWDLELSKGILRLLTDEKIELPRDYSFGFVFTKEKAAVAIDELRNKGFIENMEIRVQEFKAKLFGKELTLGSVKILIPRARPRESVDEISRRYQALSEMQDMLVQLVACGDTNPIAYLLKRNSH